MKRCPGTKVDLGNPVKLVQQIVQVRVMMAWLQLVKETWADLRYPGSS